MTNQKSMLKKKAAYYFEKAKSKHGSFEYGTALKNYHLALDFAEKHGDIVQIANVLNHTGLVHFDFADYENAYACFSQALNLWKITKNKNGLANTTNNLGLLYWKLNKYEQALEYFSDAMEIWKSIARAEGIVMSLNNKGLIYYEMGNLKKSMENHLQVLKLTREGNLVNRQAAANNNVGLLYLEFRDYVKSETHFLLAKKLNEETGHISDLSNTLKNIGRLYTVTHKTDAALENLVSGLKLAEQIDDPVLIKECCLCLYYLYLQSGNHEKALEFFKRYSDKKDQISISVNSRGLSDLQAKHEAEIYQLKYNKLLEVNKALEIEAAERKKAEVKLSILELAVDQSIDGIAVADLKGYILFANPAWAKMHGYDRKEIEGKHLSIFHTESQMNKDVAIFNKEVFEQGAFEGEVGHVRKDGTVYPTWMTSSLIKDDSGKPVGVVGISRDITERRQVEERTKATLHEKSVLLREIHHRVKNNLAIVSGLLQLQSDSIEDKKMNSIFRECQNRIQTIASIHQNLYSSSDLARVNMSEHIQSAISNLYSSFQPFSAKFNLDLMDVELEINTAIPCSLILNELISNIFKHAFPEKQENKQPTISVSMHKNDHEYKLVVSDNGIGLPDNFNIYEDRKSLGLELIRQLTSQLNGKLVVEGRNGTTFQLTFPVT